MQSNCKYTLFFSFRQFFFAEALFFGIFLRSRGGFPWGSCGARSILLLREISWIFLVLLLREIS